MLSPRGVLFVQEEMAEREAEWVEEQRWLKQEKLKREKEEQR